MIVASDKNIGKGLATRLRHLADELEASERKDCAEDAALSGVMSLAFSAFLAGRHRARCEVNFRAAVQHHKDLIHFSGRFVKGSAGWDEMLLATDPVYRRLEVARHLEKRARSLLIKAWRDADLNADESDFWGMTARMVVDGEELLLDYFAENRLIVANIREAGMEDEEAVSLRRAEANAQAAADLMAEVGINA